MMSPLANLIARAMTVEYHQRLMMAFNILRSAILISDDETDDSKMESLYCTVTM